MGSTWGRSAAWLSDPWGHAEFRWFDGTVWTHHVAGDGSIAREPEESSFTGSFARSRRDSRAVATPSSVPTSPPV